MRLPLLLLTVLSGLTPSISFSQSEKFSSASSVVYAEHPAVPRGILEAVSFTQTRMNHLDESTLPSCIGLPAASGYLGMIEDGQGYFRNNLRLVSQLSGIPADEMKNKTVSELRAWAIAYEHFAQQKMSEGLAPGSDRLILAVLKEMSFIPEEGMVNDFALNSEISEIFRFLNDKEKQQEYKFADYHFNLEQLFGANYALLSSPKVSIGESITDETGKKYQQTSVKSTEYGPAIWNAAASCNYSTRGGTAISAVTIHTIQGTYAGAISWSQNCSSSVSYHYVIRSSDGQVTQMVEEAYKAWHVGSENAYTIGYEHEGYVAESQWYTDAMYQSSAALSRDVVGSGYGIPALRTYYGASSSSTQVLGNCTKIKGHQHFANQTHTDPGVYWNWEKYYRLINNAPVITNLTTASGTFTDSGGASGNYGNDERKIWTIKPAGAATVTLSFSQFSLESGYDKLFIYNGNSISATLIGVYTGTSSPGSITSSGNALTVEFRSDCATVAAGWNATWTSNSAKNPSGSSSGLENPEMIIYPQPAENFVIIESGAGELSLTDASGRIVTQVKTEGKLRLDISSFAAGMYSVIIVGEGGVSKEKLIVSH